MTHRVTLTPFVSKDICTKISQLHDEHELEKVSKEMLMCCRLCLVNRGNMDVQNEEWKNKFFKLNIEVNLSQKQLPRTICKSCASTINIFFDTKELFHKNQWTLARIQRSLQSRRDELRDIHMLPVNDIGTEAHDSQEMEETCNAVFKNILDMKLENIPIVFSTESEVPGSDPLAINKELIEIKCSESFHELNGTKESSLHDPVDINILIEENNDLICKPFVEEIKEVKVYQTCEDIVNDWSDDEADDNLDGYIQSQTFKTENWEEVDRSIVQNENVIYDNIVSVQHENAHNNNIVYVENEQNLRGPLSFDNSVSENNGVVTKNENCEAIYESELAEMEDYIIIDVKDEGQDVDEDEVGIEQEHLVGNNEESVIPNGHTAYGQYESGNREVLVSEQEQKNVIDEKKVGPYSYIVKESDIVLRNDTFDHTKFDSSDTSSSHSQTGRHKNDSEVILNGISVESSASIKWETGLDENVINTSDYSSLYTGGTNIYDGYATKLLQERKLEFENSYPQNEVNGFYEDSVCQSSTYTEADDGFKTESIIKSDSLIEDVAEENSGVFDLFSVDYHEDDIPSEKDWARKRASQKWWLKFDGFENLDSEHRWKPDALRSLVKRENRALSEVEVQENLGDLLRSRNVETNPSIEKLGLQVQAQQLKLNAKRALTKKLADISCLSYEKLLRTSFEELAASVRPNRPLSEVDVQLEREHKEYVVKHGIPSVITMNNNITDLSFKLNMYGHRQRPALVKLEKVPIESVRDERNCGSNDRQLSSKKMVRRKSNKNEIDENTKLVHSELKQTQSQPVATTPVTDDYADDCPSTSSQPITEDVLELKPFKILKQELSTSQEVVRDIKLLEEKSSQNEPERKVFKNLQDFLKSLKTMKSLPSEIASGLKQNSVKPIMKPRLPQDNSASTISTDGTFTNRNCTVPYSNSSIEHSNTVVESSSAVSNKRNSVESYDPAHVKKRKLLSSSQSEANFMTPSRSKANSTTPSRSEANSMTPCQSKANSTTPSRSEANSMTPSRSKANSTTPSRSKANSTTPSQSEANSMTPSRSKDNSTTPSRSEATLANSMINDSLNHNGSMDKDHPFQDTQETSKIENPRKTDNTGSSNTLHPNPTSSKLLCDTNFKEILRAITTVNNLSPLKSIPRPSTSGPKKFAITPNKVVDKTSHLPYDDEKEGANIRNAIPHLDANINQSNVGKVTPSLGTHITKPKGISKTEKITPEVYSKLLGELKNVKKGNTRSKSLGQIDAKKDHTSLGQNDVVKDVKLSKSLSGNDNKKKYKGFPSRALYERSKKLLAIPAEEAANLGHVLYSKQMNELKVTKRGRPRKQSLVARDTSVDDVQFLCDGQSKASGSPSFKSSKNVVKSLTQKSLKSQSLAKKSLEDVSSSSPHLKATNDLNKVARKVGRPKKQLVASSTSYDTNESPRLPCEVSTSKDITTPLTHGHEKSELAEPPENKFNISKTVTKEPCASLSESHENASVGTPKQTGRKVGRPKKQPHLCSTSFLEDDDKKGLNYSAEHAPAIPEPASCLSKTKCTSKHSPRLSVCQKKSVQDSQEDQKPQISNRLTEAKPLMEMDIKSVVKEEVSENVTTSSKSRINRRSVGPLPKRCKTNPPGSSHFEESKNKSLKSPKISPSKPMTREPITFNAQRSSLRIAISCSTEAVHLEKEPPSPNINRGRMSSGSSTEAVHLEKEPPSPKINQGRMSSVSSTEAVHLEKEPPSPKINQGRMSSVSSTEAVHLEKEPPSPKINRGRMSSVSSTEAVHLEKEPPSPKINRGRMSSVSSTEAVHLEKEPPSPKINRGRMSSVSSTEAVHLEKEPPSPKINRGRLSSVSSTEAVHLEKEPPSPKINRGRLSSVSSLESEISKLTDTSPVCKSPSSRRKRKSAPVGFERFFKSEASDGENSVKNSPKLNNNRRTSLSVPSKSRRSDQVLSYSSERKSKSATRLTSFDQKSATKVTSFDQKSATDSNRKLTADLLKKSRGHKSFQVSFMWDQAIAPNKNEEEYSPILPGSMKKSTRFGRKVKNEA